MTNTPGRELRRQAADVHRPLHVLRALASRPCSRRFGPRSTVSTVTSDRGDDGHDDREQAQQNASEAARSRRRRLGAGFGVWFRSVPARSGVLRLVHWSTRSPRARVPPRPTCPASRRLLDRAGLRRAQLVFHLHRFDDDHALPRRDRRRRGRRARAPRVRASARPPPARPARPPSSVAPRRRVRPLTTTGDRAAAERHQQLAARRRRARPAARGCAFDASPTISDKPNSPARSAWTSCASPSTTTRNRPGRRRLDRDRAHARRRSRSRRSSIATRSASSRAARCHRLSAGPSPTPAADARPARARHASIAAAIVTSRDSSASSSLKLSPRRSAIRRSSQVVSYCPSRYAGCRISQTKNGIVVRMPSTWYSVERARHARDRVVARAAPRDELGDHRVVVDRHLVTRRSPRRRRECRDRTPAAARG